VRWGYGCVDMGGHWYLDYMAMANHLRINNDTTFRTAQAANSSIDVEAALGVIAQDYVEYLIPGTSLVDYGPAMDGFSPTYEHVMPGCSQGNNVYVHAPSTIQTLFTFSVPELR
jgi:hypothetical protein